MAINHECQREESPPVTDEVEPAGYARNSCNQVPREISFGSWMVPPPNKWFQYAGRDLILGENMKFKSGTRRGASEYEKYWVKQWKKDKTFEQSVSKKAQRKFISYFMTARPS